MYLTRDKTKILQGVAILCMLGLHLFNRIDIFNYYDVSLYVSIFGVSTPLLTIISYSFDCCVPIYLFCSGYGLAKNYMGNSIQYNNKNFTRIMNLVYRYWIIMIITCIIGYYMGMRDVYPGSLANFIGNIFLLKSSYVGAFWFVQTYILLVILSKKIFKIIEKYEYKLVIIISFLLYIFAFIVEKKILVISMNESLHLFINALMLLLRSQFSFVIGGIFAYKTIVNKNIEKLLSNNIIAALILICVISIRELVLKSMIFAPFSAIVFIILLCCHRYTTPTQKVLLYFGNHSTNMWLTHMQYYMIFATSFVFMSRNVFVIFITLIVLSLISSYIIEYVYNAINYLIYKKWN